MFQSQRFVRTYSCLGYLALGLVGCGTAVDEGDCRERHTCVTAESGGAAGEGAVAKPEAGAAAVDVDDEARGGGGQAGAPAVVEPLPAAEPGQSCDDPGALRCAGAAQKLSLVCRDGGWQESETCGADQNCDQTTGACASIAADCIEKQPGQRYCSATNTLFECGPDLLWSAQVEACAGLCVDTDTSASCAPATCGDGKVQVGESCDDANTENGDACTNACRLALCGDGATWAGHEACDDGNDSATDDCVACVAATCGDGHVWQGHETCDDTNDVNTDACTNACNKAACGDGIVQAGKEQCDDKNTKPGDGCSATCRAEAEQFALGTGVACIRSGAGTVLCNGSPAILEPDVAARDFDVGEVAEVVAGFRHVCVRSVAGKVKCAGDNDFGQLGLGDMVSRRLFPLDGAALPFVDLGAGRTAKAIAAGSRHMCALLDTGAVRCWGDNDHDQLGRPADGNIHVGDQAGEVGDALPLVSFGAGRTAKAIVAGGNFSCALLDDSTVRCWGDGKVVLAATDGKISFGAGKKVTALSAGGDFACALFSDKTMRCWGGNRYGQLGHGGTLEVSTPVQLEVLPEIEFGSGFKVAAMATGLYFACALSEDGRGKCWGQNEYGQLGLGNKDNALQPSGDLSLGTSRTIARLGAGAGASQACAVLDNGVVKCWGKGAIRPNQVVGDKANQMGDNLQPIDAQF